MGLFKKKPPTPEQIAAEEAKTFFDCICPSTVKFFPHHYIVGDTYRCVWAIKEYPPSTEEQAILSHLADHSGVTLRIYNRVVEHREHDQIMNHANRKNRLKLGDSNITEAVQAEQNLLDVTALLNELKHEREPLLHCAVFMELKAKSLEGLHSLKTDLTMEITQAKLSVDMLTLRQKEGFLSVMPFGRNQFGTQFERVLPASSVSNMFPFNFSGKTDPQGFYIGRDRFGTNIIVDLDRRADDKTTGSALILGNSGMGKSYLLKLLVTNLRESGKSIIGLDAEGEMQTLAVNNGGCYLDFLDGRYMINLLEPKAWASEPVEDPDAPEAFRRSGRISQHIAFLKDWFRSYKDFSDMEVDTIEIMLSRLYENFHMTETTDFSKLKPTDYPIMEDLFELCMEEYRNYDPTGKPLYTEDILQRICLGLNSVCVGAESRFFNGHTNIEDNKFLIFGVKGIMDLNKKYDGTLQSLADRSHRPHSHPNQHTEAEIKLIKDMRRRNPHAGLVVFWVKLRQRGYTRSISGLYRVLRRIDGKPIKLPNPKKESKPYEQMQYPGQKGQIDVKYVPKSCLVGEAEGEGYFQYTFNDEYSRFRIL